tara:strand:- start:207 stop:398 length:192 start_codon:yes stop_codon:yes gene_type:complete
MELAYKYMSQIPPKGKTKFDEEFLYTSEGNISSPRPSRNVAPAAFLGPGSKGAGFGNVSTRGL